MTIKQFVWALLPLIEYPDNCQMRLWFRWARCCFPMPFETVNSNRTANKMSVGLPVYYDITAEQRRKGVNLIWNGTCGLTKRNKLFHLNFWWNWNYFVLVEVDSANLYGGRKQWNSSWNRTCKNMSKKKLVLNFGWIRNYFILVDTRLMEQHERNTGRKLVETERRFK